MASISAALKCLATIFNHDVREIRPRQPLGDAPAEQAALLLRNPQQQVAHHIVGHAFDRRQAQIGLRRRNAVFGRVRTVRRRGGGPGGGPHGEQQQQGGSREAPPASGPAAARRHCKRGALAEKRHLSP